MKMNGLLAPYVAYTTYLGNGYATISGTSVSVPHVAGLIALMKEKSPGLSPNRIETILFESATELDPEQVICDSSGCYLLMVFQSERPEYEEGHGKMNPAKALALS